MSGASVLATLLLLIGEGRGEERGGEGGQVGNYHLQTFPRLQVLQPLLRQLAFTSFTKLANTSPSTELSLSSCPPPPPPPMSSNPTPQQPTPFSPPKPKLSILSMTKRLYISRSIALTNLLARMKKKGILARHMTHRLYYPYLPLRLIPESS